MSRQAARPPRSSPYSAKYASAFYGPFRQAVDSQLKGDRRTLRRKAATCFCWIQLMPLLARFIEFNAAASGIRFGPLLRLRRL